MLSHLFFLNFCIKLVFTSVFNKLPENFIVREIPEYFDFKDLIRLSQTNKHLREVIHNHVMSIVIKNYPNFPKLNEKDKHSFCSCLLRPCKYYENYETLFKSLPFKNYSNSEHFILAQISFPHSILENTDIAVFIMKTFIGIDNTNRSLVNHSYIEDFLIKNILPIHLLNNPVMKEFVSFYKCSRSNLLTRLYLQGHMELHPSNFFGNRLVFSYYSILWLLSSLMAGSIYQIFEFTNWNILKIVLLFFFSIFLTETLFDNFLI